MWRGFCHGFYGIGPSFWGGTWLLWLKPIISFALFLLAVYIVYKIFFSKLSVFQPKDKHLDILNERLAKGEITEEEYRKLKSLIEGK
ncbi:SHOCT domain-containing protein [Fervidobacterium nodosum]|uniref:SHOCT domain-containing protein n=1 Tax=Fervidobacterium nodosum (strain ATCC 35602 / DSM 5306 / Rt17-B1) TaxID=381764 RepID=A7HJN2_FERNB|nr:SHOCT domain-containing protein [Fervidobacterium nodosum]ABS60115.1 hypothetical protein Fnod_0248 [Fervidobacterium nodosum Rt17-B1]PHJ12230.1 hypothetical protein IM41_08085 [Fervidobacterium sp. SC_NGM5_G05]